MDQPLLSQLDKAEKGAAPKLRVDSGSLIVCKQCGSPWCRCPPGSCHCRPLNLQPNSLPLGRFTFKLQNLHTLDHSEKRLIGEVVKFVGGNLIGLQELLGNMEVEMTDAPEKLAAALSCAGFPATLKKELVMREGGASATFQVTGMTCSSCVATVENALRAVDGVSNASVNLLMKKAEVIHKGVPVEALLDAIDAVGFDAELLEARDQSPQRQRGKLIVGSFAVEGMTCASCVGAVERAITAVEGVESADVSLTAHRAEVRFHAPAQAADIVSAVEDIGFDAEFRNEVQVSAERSDRPSELSVALHGGASALELRKAATAVHGVQGVVMQRTEKHARILYNPSKVGARVLLRELQGVCEYNENIAEDPSLFMLTRLRVRFLLSLVPTLLIVLLAEGFWPDAWDADVDGIPYAFLYVLALSGFVQFFCGHVFHTAALSALQHGATTMNTLVSLSTTMSFLYGAAGGLYDATAGSESFDMHMAAMFCETSSVLISVLLGGRLLEILAKTRTTSAVKDISAKRPEYARLLEEPGGTETNLRYDLLQIGDLLRVLPGEVVPVDGEVLTDCIAYCDESLLTGESVPVKKTKGSQVIGGSSTVQTGFVMKASSAGNSTTLARILQLVEDAQTRRPTVQRTVDLLASYFTPVVLSLSAATFVVWLLLAAFGGARMGTNGITFAITRAVSVLVIACPCSFGLATPTAVMVATGVAAKHGCLVKDAVVWEKVGRLTQAVLDKTGTLTKGEPEVVAVALLPGAASFPWPSAAKEVATSAAAAVKQTECLGVEVDKTETIAVAGWLLRAVEYNSEHPLAKALLRWAHATSCGRAANASAAAHTPGQGVSCQIEELGTVRCQSLAAWQAQDDQQRQWAEKQQEGGCVVVVLEVESSAVALLAIRDEVQESAAAVVRDLHQRGLKVWMCTGDQPRTAHAVARSVGISQDRVLAGCLPNTKSKLVQDLSETEEVLMVGDGLNDAAALAAASIGVAIGTGAQVSVESAHVVLMGSKLSDLPVFMDLAAATMRTIYRNFAWALGFNLLGLPLAAGCGEAFGISLPPVACGAAMACSSVLVVSSSLLLGFCHRVPCDAAAPKP